MIQTVLSKQWLLLCALLLSTSVNAASTMERRVSLDAWPKYANGPNIAALPEVATIITSFDESDGNRIIVRYPGGAEGVLWAEKMRDWFVSYGVPLEFLHIEAGSGTADQLLLILVSQ